MDSRHRHELQQNDLGKITNEALPFFEKHGMSIVVGLLVAVVLGGIAAFWFSESSTSVSESWTQLDQALHKSNPLASDFADVADKYPGSAASAWAKLKTAEDYLKSGMQAAFSDHEASVADLKKAQEAFQNLESAGTEVSPDIRERALFGLARCLESTSDGNTDDAIKVYSRLVTDFPESMFKSIAQQRIKVLETSASKEFYTWFHQQKPEPQEPMPFPSDQPETKSSEDAVNPNESLELESPAATESTSESSEAPKDNEKPAEEKPADEKPVEEKPAGEKPAETPGDNPAP